MSSLSDLYNDIRNLGAVNDQRRLDERRREAQGTREGFARSGEPSPIPTFLGPPASGAQRSGIVTDDQFGNGVSIDIVLKTDRGRTWIYNTMNTVRAGNTMHMDTEYYLVAYDSGRFLGILGYFQAPIGHATGGFHEANYARIPCNELRAFIATSTLNTTYEFTAVWEADR